MGSEPSLPPYKVLLQDLQHTEDAASDPQLRTPLTGVHGVVHPGQPYRDAALLAYRLEVWGDLPSGQFIDNGTAIYTNELAQGIKHFQKRYGLHMDGSLGRTTIRALNAPADKQRMQQILLAIERWRWMPNDLGYSPILVNIPEYKLYAFDGNAKNWHQFEMNVVVGKKASEYHTPVIFSAIRSVEFTRIGMYLQAYYAKTYMKN